MSAAFSNGSEGAWWMSKWCNHCAHDHSMHSDNSSDGCSLILANMVDPDRMPEGWIMADPCGNPATRLACLRFEPCEPCGGDPAPDVRAEVIATIKEALRVRVPRPIGDLS